MLANATAFLLNTLLGLFTACVLLRFYLQLTGASFRNPLSQFIMAITNFAVIPARRFVPSWGKLDLSCLAVALLSQLLLSFSLKLLYSYPIASAGAGFYLAIGFASILQLAKLSIDIFVYAVIAQAVLSWVNPYTPISGVLDTLTRPVMSPIRKRVPLVGGVDLSPLVFFILAQLAIMLLIQPLENLF